MSMKSIVDAKGFSDALHKVSKVLKKGVVPCLSEVHVQFQNGRCILTGTDLETWLTTELPAQGDDFSFVFSRTKDVERACRHFDGELTMELTESQEVHNRRLRLRMQCGARAGELDALLPEDYPEAFQMEAQTQFTVNAADLLERVERVRYATLTPGQNVRESSTCVQFCGNKVFAVDGCRVACDIDERVTFPQPFLVAGTPLTYLKLFDCDRVTVQLGKRYIQVTDGTTNIRFRTAESEVFKLDQAVPKSYREEFYVSPREFLDELSYLKEFAPDTAKPYVRFSGGELSLNSNQYCTAVQVDGRSEIVFGFDLRHMKDALRQFKDEERIKVKVVSGVSPFIIEAEGRGDFAMICPVRLKKELVA